MKEIKKQFENLRNHVKAKTDKVKALYRKERPYCDSDEFFYYGKGDLRQDDVKTLVKNSVTSSWGLIVAFFDFVSDLTLLWKNLDGDYRRLFLQPFPISEF